MLKGKNILVSGASAGLGEALAHGVAKLGGNLILCARRADKLEQLRENLQKLYPNIRILTMSVDVTDKNACQDLIEKSVAAFGGLDCVIANAGKGMWSRFKDIADPDEMNDLVQVNYMGAVYLAFYALPHLRQTRGSYVAISSILGDIPFLYHSGYVAAKYALNGFIDTLRLEEPEVNFLLAKPSWISGTELRQMAVSGATADSIKVKKTHGKTAISAQDCAEQIISAMLKRHTELYIPKIHRFVPTVRQLCKSWVDKLINARVSHELKK